MPGIILPEYPYGHPKNEDWAFDTLQSERLEDEMNDAMLALVVHECQPAVNDCAGSIEDKARAAMKVAKDHWMVLDRDTQFRGAVGALLIHYGTDSPEYARISAELASIRKLAALIQAGQAGLSVNLSEDDLPTHEPIGLMKLWHEATA